MSRMWSVLQVKRDIYFSNLVRMSAMMVLPAMGLSHREVCSNKENVFLLSCRPNFSCILRTTCSAHTHTHTHTHTQTHGYLDIQMEVHKVPYTPWLFTES